MSYVARAFIAVADFAIVFSVLRWLAVGTPVALAIAAVSAVTVMAILMVSPRHSLEPLERLWWLFLSAGVAWVLLAVVNLREEASLPASLVVANLIVGTLMAAYGFRLRSLLHRHR